MSRILIYSIGTRGDFQPYLTIAKHLKSKNYEVGLATHEIFQVDTQKSGISFFGIAQKDPNDILLSREFKEAFYRGGMQEQARVMGKGMDYMPGNFRALWTAAQEFQPDLILCTVTTICESLAISQKLLIPMVVMSTFPYYASGSIAPAAAFSTPFQYSFLNSLMHSLSATVLWAVISKIVNDFRAELQLPPQNGFVNDCFPIYNIYSSLVSSDPEDWDPNRIKTVGYLIDTASQNFTPPTELQTFLDAGEAPVYIGLGSMPILDCEKFARDTLEAVKFLGVRAILCAGWSELDAIECPESCMFIKGAPHEWLFPRCKIIIHHGGAGTTAASLRAGVPTVIFSVLGDQPFWAQKVYELGCGPKPIANGIKAYSTETLVTVLREVLDNRSYFEKAADLGARLQFSPEENGCVNATALIEAYLSQHRNRGYGKCTWKEDSQASKCVTCPANFGFFVHRHHCRSCGDIFCWDCVEMCPLLNYKAPQLMCARCRDLRSEAKAGRDVDENSDGDGSHGGQAVVSNDSDGLLPSSSAAAQAVSTPPPSHTPAAMDATEEPVGAGDGVVAVVSVTEETVGAAAPASAAASLLTQAP